LGVTAGQYYRRLILKSVLEERIDRKMGKEAGVKSGLYDISGSKSAR
jgi:hypothetical protein